MDIRILGAGCANCRTLEARTVDALRSLGVTASVEEVTDYAEIAAYGVMSTPALAVDDRIVVAGRVPTVDELVGLLREASA